MGLELKFLVGLLVGGAVAFAGTPVAIRLAARFDFYDKPVGYKGHGAPTPYLGGLAVLVAFGLAALAVSVTADAERTLAIVGGMVVLWVVGTVDDRRHVSPGARVAVEVAVALALWAAGLGWSLGLGGALDAVITCVWVIAVVNAFNLFDNMDGASSTMAAVASLTVACFGLATGDEWVAATGAALAGACGGFLPHNLARPNAKIFLGDGGSMPVGFAVAALVMFTASDALVEWQSLAIGLLLVGIPALDTALVVISRRRKGISILTGGRDHLTHRTHRRFEDARVVAAALGAVQALVSVLALFATRGGSGLIVLVVVLYLAAAGVAIALFEQQEHALADAAPRTGRALTGPLRLVTPAYAILALVGMGAAASPFLSSFYGATTWVPIGIALLVVTTAVVMSGARWPDRPATLCLGCFAGLAAWSVLSSAWAESARQATVAGNRWVVLATALVLLTLLLQDRRRAAWLLGAMTAGSAAVGLYVLVRMFGLDPGDLFLRGRLDQPLGYINGQGTVFLMGAWLALGFAEPQTGRRAGAAMAGAIVLLGLLVLTQSRGALVAAAVSVVVVFALIPGRRRRLVVLLTAAIGAGTAMVALTDVYTQGSSGPLTDATTRAAALWLLAGAAVGGALWAVASTWMAKHDLAALDGLRRRFDRTALVLAAGSAIVLLVLSGRIVATVQDQYDGFVSLGARGPGEAETRSRLSSGGGTRYDYWRVGMNAFAESPVLGKGAGNYDASYFAERRTAEDVRQPHSIVVQVLAETGTVGFLLLLGFVAFLLVAARRAAGAARQDPATAALLVGATGGASAWLAHTSTDWIHLLPGTSVVALACVAVLLRTRPIEAPPSSLRVSLVLEPRQILVAALLAVGLIGAVASLGRQGLSDVYRERAQGALDRDPRAALRDADRALRLDGEDVPSYYVRAAAVARMGNGEAAEQTLRRALSAEPHDFVTWALLGDLAVRRGRPEDARAYYGRAIELNPQDPSLPALLERVGQPGY